MSKEIESAVFELVIQAGVNVSITAMGATVRDTWECDEWRVKFAANGGAGHAESFEYFTGMGLRAEPTAAQKQAAKWGLPGLTQKDIERRTIYGRRYLAELEKVRKPVAPHVAGVLHSLILDSSATQESFADWCGNFGYDTDSRKAHALYEACQQNADKLARVFTHAQRAALTIALQDY